MVEWYPLNPNDSEPASFATKQKLPTEGEFTVLTVVITFAVMSLITPISNDEPLFKNNLSPPTASELFADIWLGISPVNWYWFEPGVDCKLPIPIIDNSLKSNKLEEFLLI